MEIRSAVIGLASLFMAGFWYPALEPVVAEEDKRASHRALPRLERLRADRDDAGRAADAAREGRRPRRQLLLGRGDRRHRRGRLLR
jgi:hypothetical protein